MAAASRFWAVLNIKHSLEIDAKKDLVAEVKIMKNRAIEVVQVIVDSPAQNCLRVETKVTATIGANETTTRMTTERRGDLGGMYI